MDPALRQMIAADNAKQAQEYYGTRDLIVVFSADAAEDHVQAVGTALLHELNTVEQTFSSAITRAELKVKIMSRREVPPDVVSLTQGVYWYVVVTYSAEGLLQREAVANTIREKLRALAASGLNFSEISSGTAEYKVLALLFGHPVG